MNYFRFFLSKVTGNCDSAAMLSYVKSTWLHQILRLWSLDSFWGTCWNDWHLQRCTWWKRCAKAHTGRHTGSYLCLVLRSPSSCSSLSVCLIDFAFLHFISSLISVLFPPFSWSLGLQLFIHLPFSLWFFSIWSWWCLIHLFIWNRGGCCCTPLIGF